jgi:hypothetical protein
MKPRSLAAILTATFVVALGGRLAGAGEGEKPTPAGPSEEELFERIILPPSAISRVVDAWQPMLRACWVAHATAAQRATGTLSLELVISREGIVWRRKLLAPARGNPPLERCVFRLVDAMRFPWRSGYTTAVVPFVFLQTRARGAGPLPGCYSLRGCRTPRRDVRTRRGATP